MNRTLWLTAPLFAVFVSGCVVRGSAEPVAVNTEVDTATAYPTVPPPAPMAEYRPPPPGYGYYWVDGYWDWTGYDWSWNAGFWSPARPGYVYVAPRYVFDGGRYVLYRGYWNDNYGHRDYYYNANMRGHAASGWMAGRAAADRGCARGATAERSIDLARRTAAAQCFGCAGLARRRDAAARDLASACGRSVARNGAAAGWRWTNRRARGTAPWMA